MPFAQAVRERCQEEANELVIQGLRPPQVFGSLCDFLRSHRMEIPAYSAFVDMINRAIQVFDAYLRQVLHTQLDEAQRASLHSLLEQTVDEKTPHHTTAPMQLTQLADELRSWLRTQFGDTMFRIDSGQNLWVENRKDNTLRFKTPVLDESDDKAPVDLFSQDRVIPLYEVLETVKRVCRFSDTFEAVRLDHQWERPVANLFLAGIIGLGCNLTTQRVAKTAKNLSAATLETTVRNYFISTNLLRTNDQVSALIEQMNVGAFFDHNPQGRHTSSDEQKFAVGLDSIHSTYSAKYFGKEKGITIYSFINAIHNLFYTTAFSASDREAWYVIDGLMHNDVVRSQIHSTDSHGATDPVFSVSYLLGSEFQPRLADLHRQKLHGMEGVSKSHSMDYQLALGEEMDEAVVARQWDRILHLVVSIKLKYTLALMVMKRLNSYALQNPLYQALKELGKVVRTRFLLRYMDDKQMRYRTHQQQEKIESAHALSRATHHLPSLVSATVLPKLGHSLQGNAVLFSVIRSILSQ